MTVMSRNKVSIEELQIIIEHGEWVRVELKDKPECFKNIPDDKVKAIYASGSQIFTPSEDRPVLGIDVVREDPRDIDKGGRINIDHYDGCFHREEDGTLLIALTDRILKENHWCDEVPEVYSSPIKAYLRPPGSDGGESPSR